MNRRNATFIAAGATFVLLSAGIASGGFFGAARSVASHSGPSLDTVAADVTAPGTSSDKRTPGVVSDRVASAGVVLDLQSSRGVDDDANDDRLQRKADDSKRARERDSDGRIKGEDR